MYFHTIFNDYSLEKSYQ